MKAVTVRGGSIFWRGMYRSPDEAGRLAEQFEGVTDWFAPSAQKYARELRAAIRKIQPMEIAA